MKTSHMVMLIAAGAMVMVTIFVIITSGAAGIATMIKNILIWGLILVAIGLIVAGVIWLFQTKKIDLVAVHKERVVKACRLNQVPYLQLLKMRSYGDDWASRTLGTIVGMCVIKHAPMQIVEGEGYEQDLEVAQDQWEDLIFVTFRPPGFINKLFGNVEVVGGTKEDFSRLSGDTVFLNGMTFAPEIYNILFLSHHWEPRHIIDETIKGNIYRYTLEQNLKELSTMMEDAIDASPRHKKAQEVSNIQNLPAPVVPAPMKQ